MRVTQLIASLILASFACLSYAQDDIDTTIDEGPSWTAGGHYTAELNLSANYILNINYLEDGIYFYKISGKEGAVKGRLLKQ